MAKKRTRAQKIRLTQRRAQPAVQPAVSLDTIQKTQPKLVTVFSRRDLIKTLVSTAIVLGVLSAVLVYTRMSF